METKSYTLAELQAMPDNDLNAMAAELRGLRNIEGDGGIRDWIWVDVDGQFYDEIFLPTTDRNQSREILDWFVEAQWKAGYTIRYGKIIRSVSVTAAADGDDVNVEVNGAGAKAETIAFCAAMQAMAGRLK